MRMEKWITKSSILLLAVILLLTGGLFGMKSEKERIIQEEKSETVINIAIVNMDEGIYENNQKRYYSSELMDLEADNLISENLESARMGINNGSYAAYILIPPEFSQNAVSINGIPQKATLEFAVNPNLREDISRLTMANVKNFEISLNTNMSYMYVQAILTEFHNVQDSAGTILGNDAAELTRLLEIDPQNLMAELEFIEMERIDADLEDADFDEVFDNNIQISKELQDNYDSFAEEGEEAFEQIKEGELTVAEGMDSFYEAMGEIDIETDTGGTVVYEAGLIALTASVEKYEQEFQEQKAKIAAMLELPTPTAAPTETPTAAPTKTSSEVPAATPTETPTPTPVPSPVLIPQLIEEMMKASLEDINEELEEINKKNEEEIQTIKKNIEQLENRASIAEFSMEKEEKPGEAALQPEDAEKEGTKPEGTEEGTKPEGTEEESTKPEGTEESTKPEGTEEEGTKPEGTEEEGTKPEGTEEESPQPEESEKENAKPENSENNKETTITINAANGNYQKFYLLSAKSRENSMEQFPEGTVSMAASINTSAADYLEEIKKSLANIQSVDPITAQDIYQEEKIKEGLSQLIDKIDNLPVIDTVVINEILEQEILQPLEEEIQNENTRVQDEGSKYLQTMDAYMEELAGFDAYKFYDYEKMDELLYSFEDNIFDLEEQVIDSNESYADFAFDVYEKTDENVADLQTNLEEAYQGTTQNVQKEVDLAKKYRQEINAQNTALLNEFTQKLLYTRVGNLEYVQAYDFIVKPVQMADTSVKKNRVSVLHDYNGLKNILIVLIALWCLLMCSLLILKLHTAAGRNPDRE